jgi:hypothetical protein
MNSSGVDECPSCGGQSLSQTGDEGALVCDDCDEQFQGFRAEELDEEYASRMTVFRRTSQSSRAERRRLVAEAENARTALKISSSQTGAVDSSRLVYEGVVIISRAIVDALVHGEYAPRCIIDICFKIVSHWVRMCHAGAVAGARGLSPIDFSAHSILAFISLAAVFVRSSLLPRDLCVLAAQKKIPFITACVDLLDPRFSEAKLVRKALCPAYLPIAHEIVRRASTIALSNYSWPPLKAYFDGESVIYTHWSILSFPLGQYEATLLRIVRLLGLPDDFCKRVQRYRELRRVATAMNLKTHAMEKMRRKQRLKSSRKLNLDLGPCNANRVSENSGSSWLEQTLDVQSHERQPSEAISGLNAVLNDANNHDLANPLEHGESSVLIERQRGQDAELNDSDCNDHDKVKKICKRTTRKRSSNFEEELLYNTYEVDDDCISSWPFSVTASDRRTLLTEFATDRTLAVDCINTMRICFGAPTLNEVLRSQIVPECVRQVENDINSPKFELEWTSCLRTMHTLLADQSTATDALSWSSLSPTAISSIKGSSLSDFIETTLCSMEGALPLFMNDHAELFGRLGGLEREKAILEVSTNARQYQGKASDRNPEFRSGPSSALPCDDVRAIGRWVWNRDVESESIELLKAGAAPIGSLPGVERRPLLPARGHNSDEMIRQRVRRRVVRTVKAGHSLWDEPVGIDWAIVIVQRFFLGSFANVGWVNGECPASGDNLRLCLDSVMRTVLNYADVQLGEVGKIDRPSS